MKRIGAVSELWRYPVSSMAGEPLEETGIGAGGVPGDRIWGVMDQEEGDVARPERHRKWHPLPGLSARLTDSRPQVAERDGPWFDAGSAEAANLLSDRLERPVSLLPHTPYGTEKPGRIAPRYERADLHVLTTSSMHSLASTLPDPGQIASRRFRPNVVIGTDAGFEDLDELDYIGQHLIIGEARIAISEPCRRCGFTILHQGGLDFEPAILRQIVQQRDRSLGVLCRVEKPGRIAIGDPVMLTGT